LLHDDFGLSGDNLLLFVGNRFVCRHFLECNGKLLVTLDELRLQIGQCLSQLCNRSVRVVERLKAFRQTVLVDLRLLALDLQQLGVQ
jgi:hypothetical protein